jgi:hypothetical protein
MMLDQQIDMQWYCIEYAQSFNDLSTLIANGDYLYATLCFKSFSRLCELSSPTSRQNQLIRQIDHRGRQPIHTRLDVEKRKRQAATERKPLEQQAIECLTVWDRALCTDELRPEPEIEGFIARERGWGDLLAELRNSSPD